MLYNLKIDSRSEQTTFSVHQVAGKDKHRYQIGLTEATADKISGYASRNAKWFNGYQVAAVGLLAVVLVVCIVPCSLAATHALGVIAGSKGVIASYAALHGPSLGAHAAYLASEAAIMGVDQAFGLMGIAILGSTIGSVVAVAGAAFCFNKGINASRKSLFSSMKHDQIIEFCKEVGITIDDLFPVKDKILTEIMRTDKKQPNVEIIKMIFDLDTDKKERTQEIILEAVRSYPEIWEELQSVMMEERYKGFCDVRSPLYDQKFEEALRKTLMAHSKIATADPVYSVLDVTQQNLYPRVPPLNPRLAALLTVKA